MVSLKLHVYGFMFRCNGVTDKYKYYSPAWGIAVIACGRIAKKERERTAHFCMNMMKAEGIVSRIFHPKARPF